MEGWGGGYRDAFQVIVGKWRAKVKGVWALAPPSVEENYQLKPAAGP